MTDEQDVQARLAATLAPMPNMTLFVALRSTVDAAALGGRLLLEHLQWMIDHEAGGLVFASGPFEVDGVPRGAGGGMTILRVADEAQARALLDTDPFVRSGAVRYELRCWRLMEGSLGLGLQMTSGKVVFT